MQKKTCVALALVLSLFYAGCSSESVIKLNNKCSDADGVVLSCEDFMSAGRVLQAFPGQVTNNVKVNDRAVQRMINK